MFQDIHIIQIYSGLTRARVLNGELYTQRLQKLIYLYLFTDCFMKFSHQSSEQISDDISIMSMLYIQHFGRVGILNDLLS